MWSGKTEKSGRIILSLFGGAEKIPIFFGSTDHDGKIIRTP